MSSKSPDTRMEIKGLLGRDTPILKCKVSGCGKGFASTTNLNKHIRNIHLKLKPHKCPHEGCPKKFNNKCDAEKHNRAVHLDERPYLCRFCGKGFTDSSNCSKHVKVVHLKQKIKPNTSSSSTDIPVRVAGYNPCDAA